MRKTTVIFILSLLSHYSITAQEKTIPKGYWEIPQTSIIFKVGGFVKLDAIHDFNNISQPYYFDVSKIATEW